MSGIYIPGMEMPKNCIDCPCYYPEYYECNIIHNCNPISLDDPIPQYCPLVSVPDHGRLIDADAMSNDGWVLHKQVMRMGGFAIHEMPLKCPSLPTIIPADKGGADDV